MTNLIDSIAKAVTNSDETRLRLLELQQIIQLREDGSVIINLGYGATIESRKGEVIVTTNKNGQLQEINLSKISQP